MAKFFSRLFKGTSSFHGSTSSLTDTHNRSVRSSNLGTNSSINDSASYRVNSKELSKNKLHKAVWEGNLKKVKRLARPGQINVRDQQMRTPLHLAVDRGHLDIVTFLVQENATLDAQDDDRRTPLVKAVLSVNQDRNLNYRICQSLISGGADAYINHPDENGKNALHYAIELKNEPLVHLFLSTENCNPDFTDGNQMTPLHLAVARNSPTIVQLLLSSQHERQADPNIVNQYGQTPLHVAAGTGCADVVRSLLVSYGSEQCNVDIRDFQQLTAYEVAKANHQSICAKLIEEYKERSSKNPVERLKSTSLNQQTSLVTSNSISLVPAANLERGENETSDDSSISANSPSKTSPRRVQRPSDQWSDDITASVDQSQMKSYDLQSLLKSNPLQPDVMKTNGLRTKNSVLDRLVTSNPLQIDSKTSGSTGKRTTLQQTQSSSMIGIGPVLDRKDSDNTSTSVSIDKPTQHFPEEKPVTSNIYVNIMSQPISNIKSWSDDTLTGPDPHVRNSERYSNTWDTSPSDDDATILKPKPMTHVLQKTLPFSTSRNELTDSESDNSSVETEIRKDELKSSNESTVQKLINEQIGNRYKVIRPSEIPSPINEESSWTSSSVKKYQPSTTKTIENLVLRPQVDDSTWSDSRSLKNDIKHSINSHHSSSLTQSRNSSHVQSKGIDNLAKIMDTVIHSKQHQSPSSNIVGKLLTSSMTERTDSTVSESTLHEADNEEYYDKIPRKKTKSYSVAANKQQDNKTIQQLPRLTLPYDINNLQGSVSSTKTSFNEEQLSELKENIKRLERNQEDTLELKRQLRDMENKKNNFERLYQENNLTLRHIESKLEQEKHEKKRLEWTTKNLNMELENTKQKLQLLEDEKNSLNQRYIKLKEERDHHDEKLRMFQENSLQLTVADGFTTSDIDKMKNRHHEGLKLLSAENEDLHSRTQQLQSELELHKESLNITARYKIDLENALEEKNTFQHELDRLKSEKDLIEQEKMEYKNKYNNLQEEIRVILLDRSKLEQKLTSELQEHIQERQRSTDDVQKYRTDIEQLNIKLNDAEARLRALQMQNESLSATKDRNIKHEFESRIEHLNQIESENLNSQRSDHNPNDEIVNKQQNLNEPLTPLTTTLSNNRSQGQRLPSLPNTQHNLFQRSYGLEHPYYLQTERINKYLRDMNSRQAPHYGLNKPFSQEQSNENYLIENSRQIRSDTENVKSKLDRLRQDFDKLVSNYEPSNHLQNQTQLHSQVDIFRQFYEQEFRQRQIIQSKLGSGIRPATALSRYRSSLHDHSPNGTCTYFTNRRLLRERLETAIDTSLADQRLQAVKQIPIVPRRASSLLTINTFNDDTVSSN